MAQNAIPPNVNLAKTIPEAIPAYTRRFKSIATNQQSFKQQSYVNVTLDTSTAGSFIDPLQSYLKFDLQLNNENPFIDYCSFGAAGAAAVIEEFRIFNQGTPVEEILYYNNLCEFMMDFMGQSIKPLHMYKPSKIRQPVSEVHSVNAIKAPMTNLSGSAMHCQSISSAYVRNNYSSIWAFNGTTNTLLGTSAPFSYELNFATGLSVNPMLATQAGAQNTSNAGPPVTLVDPVSLQPSNWSPLQGYFNANVNALTLIQGVNTDNTGLTPSIGTTSVPYTTNFNVGGLITQMATSSTRLAGSSSNISPIIPYLPPSHAVFGNTAQILLNPDFNPSNPLNWPFVMPNDSDYCVDSVGPSNLQDYFMYLSNVKEIPVGIPGSQRGDGSSVYTDSKFELTSLNFTNSAPLSQNTTYSSTYTVCLPLLSGILGSMAEKCFPSMLAAPGSLYIQLRLATNEKALQVSMDPCRRVLGTTRDYIPFGGSIGNIFGAYSAGGLATQQLRSAANFNESPNIVVGGSISSLGSKFYTVSNSTSTLPADNNTIVYSFYNTGNLAKTPQLEATALAPAGFVYDSFTASKFGTPQNITLNANTSAMFGIDKQITDGLVLSTISNTLNSTAGTAGVPVNHPVLGNPYSVIGANLLGVQGRLKSINNTLNVLFTPYSVAAMEGYWTAVNFVEAEQSNLMTSFQQPTAYGRNPGLGVGVQYENNGDQITIYGGGVRTGITKLGPTTFNEAATALTGMSKMYGTDLVYTSNAQGFNSVTGSFTPNIVQPYFPLQANYNFGSQQLTQGTVTSIIAPIQASTLSDYYPVNVAPNTLISLNSGQFGLGSGSIYGSAQTFITGANSNILNPTLSKFTPGITGTTLAGAETSPEIGFPTTGGMTSHTRLQMNPGGVPLPQYVLVQQPWLLKEFKATLVNGTLFSPPFLYPTATVGAAVTSGNLATEAQACYGTFLEHSRAQAMRVFSCPFTTRQPTLSYTLRNVEFVGQQIILPEAITASVLELAAGGGDISIYTTSVRSYLVTLSESTTQNIIIPAKIASANSLFVTFAPSNYTSGPDSQLYNSLSRFCPFSKISNSQAATKASTSAILGTSPANGLGFTEQFTIKNTPANSGVFEIQLRLGNELIPQQPLTAVSEIVAELLKCGHKLFDTEAKINTTFSLTTAAGISSSNKNTDIGTNILSQSDPNEGLYFDCLRNRDFTAAFTNACWLDDQTFINNPNTNYIASCAPELAPNTSTTTPQNPLWAVRNANVLPHFLPVESTFAIGFDLDTWSKYSDVARSGKFLGNNTITLYLTNCIGFSGWSESAIQGIVMYAFVPHDLRLSFQAGGSLISYF